MDKQFDVVVIGGGPGGYVAAIRCAQLGLKVACIEKRKTFGGTCLNVGCIPSKALLQSSEHFYRMKNHGAEHGVSFTGLKPDLSAMMERKASIVDGLTKGVAGLLKKNKIEAIIGHAKLLSPTEILVDDKETILAKHIILATGSESIELPFLKFDEKKIVSSTGALELPQIPKEMLVIGAGVIGLELASVYSRLGAKVTVIEMLPGPCPGMDGSITKAITKIMKKQGLTFHFGTQVKSGGVKGKKVELELSNGETLSGDVCLVAIGRRPFSVGLGLKEAGILQDERGFVQVNGSFQTNHPNVYAIGDLIDGPMLAHKASDEGVAVAEIIAGQSPHVNYMAIPNIVYTDPEVACIGLTEEAAKAAGLDIRTGTYAFRGNARARCAGEEEGLVKVIAEKESDQLIGMHIIGSHASEMIHEGMTALEAKTKVLDIGLMPNGHPTLSEAIKEAALNAHQRTIHL